MNLSALDNALWAASLICHVALLLVLVLRRRVKVFPVFTAFVASEVLRTVLLFCVLHFGSKHTYFVTYWTTGFANYLFQAGLIVEIGIHVLRPTGRWILEARQAFLVWGAVGLGLAAMVAYNMGPPQSRGLDLWDTRITVYTGIVTCGLFLALMTAANRLGLRWGNQAYAIGQGLFLWSAIALLGDVAHTALGWTQEFVLFDHLQMLTYLAVVLFWTRVFWLPEQERSDLSPEIRRYLLAAAERLHYDQKVKYPSL